MQILKRIGSVVLRIGISVFLLIFLFKQVDERVLLQALHHADKRLLLLAFLVFFASYVLCIFRWKMLLKGAQIHLPLGRVIISFAGGIFFNLLMPSTIGGDFVRSVDLATHTKKPHEVVATVLLDRLSGYIGLAVVALVAVVLGWKFIRVPSVLVSLGIIISLLLIILAVLFNRYLYVKINRMLTASSGRLKKHAFLPKVKEIIKNLHHEVYIFRNKKRIIIKNILLSFFVQITAPITFYLIALSLGIHIRIIYFFVFLPIIGAIALLPISIGGLGLRDATTVFFFTKVGVGKDLAFTMSLLNFFFIVICAGLGGLIYVLTVHHRRIQPHKASPV